MGADPLSELLALVRPRFSVAAVLDVGGAWCLAFPGGNEIRFQAVIAGECLLQSEQLPEKTRLGPGDCFVSIGEPFRIASDLNTPATPAISVFSRKRDGVAVHNGGGDFVGVGCLFLVEEEHAKLLRELLPRMMRIGHSEATQVALRASLDQMASETRLPQPGGKLVMQHLSQMLLIQALRLEMAAGSMETNGWLAALKDQRMSRALAGMHDQPGRNWTLKALAEAAGMSRTSFALHFKAMVGVSPLEYLTRWRMLRAAESLQNATEPVREIARSVGYNSESAFGVAFKRVMGRPPRRGGRGRTAEP